MTIQPDDLLYISRGGSGFKTEYASIKGDILNEISSGGCHVGDTAPDDPYEGDLWWNPDLQEMRVWVTSVTEGIVTGLGVRGGGTGYSAAEGVPAEGGHGNDLTVKLNVDGFGQITSAQVTNGGHGYNSDDLVLPNQHDASFGTLQVQTINSAPTGSWQVAGYNLSNLPEAN